MDRLKGAQYANYMNPDWIAAESNSVDGISYGGNGNLLSLRRNGSSSSDIDNLGYCYDPGTNRMDYVTDAVVAGSPNWDVEDGAVTYDKSGRLLTAPPPYDLARTDYDERGLPTQLVSHGNNLTHRYRAGGERYWKNSFVGEVEKGNPGSSK